jgi:hypothetical protein
MSENPEKPRQVKPWDMLNPNQPRSTKQLVEERLSICRDCEFFNSLTVGCNKCGCFLRMKTKLHNATCPIGRW